MKHLLDQFVRESQKHCPSKTFALNPPATDSQIVDAETKLGIAFPQELRELLLCANGQAKASIESTPLFPWLVFGSGTFGVASCAWLNSVDEVVLLTDAAREQYQDMMDERFDIVGPANFHDKSISFTSGFNSDSLYVDMKPCDGGTIGQIVCIRTQPCQIDVLAPSLRAFFELMLDCLHRGDWEIRDGELRLYFDAL